MNYDFRKAFDTISISKLVIKLQAYGIQRGNYSEGFNKVIGGSKRGR